MSAKTEPTEPEDPMLTFFHALIRDNPQSEQKIIEQFASGKAFGESGKSGVVYRETKHRGNAHDIYGRRS